MTEPYVYPAIWINGRFAGIEQIISGGGTPLTPFERSTFSFIKDWLSQKNDFEITTSGSTGFPKKIISSREQMMASAFLTAQVLRLEKGQSCLICIDTKYIGGRMMLVRALTLGLRIYAVDPCANPLEKIPSDQWVNFAAFVPYQVENILASEQSHLLDHVRKAIIGGAPLNSNTIDALDNFQCQLYSTYGMTETVSHIALRKLNGEGKQTFFRTLPGVTIDLDDRQCAVLSVPYIPEKIVTNDLVRRLSPSTFEWIGRYDNVINSGGIKVSPEKVESVIQAHFTSTGYSPRFFIHGVPDRRLGSRVVLVIEANTPDEEFLKSIVSSLQAVLSPYEIPREAMLVSKFFETENGKINRLQTVKGFHANVFLK
jgi:o-succinylbenzoate---CoA ligase